MDDSVNDLKPLLPEKFQDSIDSSDAFLQDIEPLSSILENIPVTEEAWEFIENAIDTLAQVRMHGAIPTDDIHPPFEGSPTC